MKLPDQEQQLTIITVVLRTVLWLLFIGFIVIDALVNSMSADGLYWLPWIGVGALFTWQMDTYISEDRFFPVLLLFVPFMVLADFVQG